MPNMRTKGSYICTMPYKRRKCQGWVQGIWSAWGCRKEGFNRKKRFLGFSRQIPQQWRFTAFSQNRLKISSVSKNPFLANYA